MFIKDERFSSIYPHTQTLLTLIQCVCHHRCRSRIAKNACNMLESRLEEVQKYFYDARVWVWWFCKKRKKTRKTENPQNVICYHNDDMMLVKAKVT